MQAQEQTQETYTQFKAAYIEELALFLPTLPTPSKYTPEEKANSMIEAVRKGGKCDWLNDNPAMRKAARRIMGSKVKSADVRALVKEYASTTL